jgi:hypothetical protein
LLPWFDGQRGEDVKSFALLLLSRSNESARMCLVADEHYAVVAFVPSFIISHTFPFIFFHYFFLYLSHRENRR